MGSEQLSTDPAPAPSPWPHTSLPGCRVSASMHLILDAPLPATGLPLSFSRCWVWEVTVWLCSSACTQAASAASKAELRTWTALARIPASPFPGHTQASLVSPLSFLGALTAPRGPSAWVLCPQALPPPCSLLVAPPHLLAPVTGPAAHFLASPQTQTPSFTICWSPSMSALPGTWSVQSPHLSPLFPGPGLEEHPLITCSVIVEANEQT